MRKQDKNTAFTAKWVNSSKDLCWLESTQFKISLRIWNMTSYWWYKKNSYWRVAEGCYCPDSLSKKTMVAFKSYEDSNNGGKNKLQFTQTVELVVPTNNHKSGMRFQCSKTLPWEYQLFPVGPKAHKNYWRTPLDQQTNCLCSSLNLINPYK